MNTATLIKERQFIETDTEKASEYRDWFRRYRTRSPKETGKHPPCFSCSNKNIARCTDIDPERADKACFRYQQYVSKG